MTLIIVNPKGRAVSAISIVAWVICLAMLILRGQWELGQVLLAVLFVLLMCLSGLRIYQEWVEDGEWLD